MAKVVITIPNGGGGTVDIPHNELDGLQGLGPDYIHLNQEEYDNLVTDPIIPNLNEVMLVGSDAEVETPVYIKAFPETDWYSRLRLNGDGETFASTNLDIITNGEALRFAARSDDNNTSSIKMSYEDGTNEKQVEITNEEDTGIKVIDSVDQIGLQGEEYYGDNATDNTYIQKKYIDDLMPKFIPLDKTNVNYPGTDYLGNLAYYFEGTVVNQPDKFKALYFKSNGTTIVNIAFFTISAGIGTILYTKDVNAVSGINSFGFYDFDLPSSVKNTTQFYIAIKPTQNDKINFSYTGGNVQILNTDNTITNTLASIPFWIEIEGFNKFTLNTYQDTKSLIEETSAIVNYDYINNPAILPSHLYIRDDKPTNLHKMSMYRDIRSVPNTLMLSNGKYLEINNPTKINQSDVGDEARIIVNKNTDVGKFVYKDLEIIKASLADKVGQTINVMCIGDSLTEGGDGTPSSSPTLLSKRILDELTITMNTLGTLQRTDVETYQNEGRGGWRFRTFTGLESKFAGVDVVIPSPTQRVWIEGVDGTIVQIKSNNPWLYEATIDDKTNYPERCYHFVSGNTVNNLSYAQNPSLGTYMIFDPARYLSERGIDTPDIVTIALGTNEWYLNDFSGFDINLIYENARWMIERITTAMPTAKIIVIPCNNFPASLEYYWYRNAFIVTSLILKICDEFRALGNNNLYTLSIFAQCPRTLTYENIGTSTNISPYTTTKQADSSIDVHILNTDNQSRADYLEAYVDAIICSI